MHETSTYTEWHRRHYELRRDLGTASLRTCVDCAGQASEWSLKRFPLADLHVVAVEGSPLWWSPLDFDYEPRCGRCHRVEDSRRAAEERVLDGDLPDGAWSLAEYCGVPA